LPGAAWAGAFLVGGVGRVAIESDSFMVGKPTNPVIGRTARHFFTVEASQAT
jgi:hypothetical protein